MYEAPVQKGNTAIFQQIDRNFNRERAYQAPINQYQPVPENRQDSIYVVMDGTESIQQLQNIEVLVSHPEESVDDEGIYFQEPSGGEIGFYDSFQEYEEDYAEMTTPSEHLRSVSMSIHAPCTFDSIITMSQEPKRKPFNIYGSFGPKEFNYCNYMKVGDNKVPAVLYKANYD